MSTSTSDSVIQNFQLCHRCACAIENDDYSAFDLTDGTDSAAEFDRVNDFVVSAGIIVIDVDCEEFVGKCDACQVDQGGYFTGHSAQG